MPEKPQKHTPPSKQTVDTPIVAMENTSYKFFTGNRGRSGNNNILQSDAPGKECVILQSKTGNVFLEASKIFQSECQTRFEEVNGDKLLFTKSYTMNNMGDVTANVDGNTVYNANSDFMLNVVGTHTENVNIQAINAQSQTVKVSGAQDISVVTDRTLKVGGTMTEEVGGDVIQSVSGKKELKVGMDLLNTYLGSVTWMKGSTDRGITISDKEQVNISGEISLNVGASEKFNVGAHFEQTFGYKNVVLGAGQKTTLVGPAKTAAASAKTENVALIRSISTSIAKYEAKIASDKARMRSFDFTIAMFL